MLKNKLDYKLVNLTLIALIAFLIYMTGSFWIGIINKIVQIVLPFLFSFAIAYAFYPFLQKMQAKKIPKWASVTIIVVLILGLLALVVYLVTTVLFGQLTSLFNNIIGFLKSIQNTNFDIAGIEGTISNAFKDILANLGNIVSDGALNLIGLSLGLLSKIFIGFASFIYFLIDMKDIRREVKFFLSKKSKRAYDYVKTLDGEMRKYLFGLIQVIGITLVEYTLVYTIIGHPNAILLGFLAAVSNLIPYFGGICVNIIASITAFVVSPALLIRTIIAFGVLSSVDSYVINPTVYGKTNSIHPLITIIALFAGGIIFGIMGVFISFPLTIIIVTTYKFFKKEITSNIKKIMD